MKYSKNPRFLNFIRNGQYAINRDQSSGPAIDLHGKYSVQRETNSNKTIYKIENRDNNTKYTLSTNGLLDEKRWNPIAAEESNGKNICIYQNTKTNQLRYTVNSKKWRAQSFHKVSDSSNRIDEADFDAIISNNSFTQSGINKSGYTTSPAISDATGDGTPLSLFSDGALLLSGVDTETANTLSVEATNKNGTVVDLGTIQIEDKKTNYYLSLRDKFDFSDAVQEWTIQVTPNTGSTYSQELSLFKPAYIPEKETKIKKGNIMSNIFEWDYVYRSPSSQQMVIGGGGTDLLDLRNFMDKITPSSKEFSGADIYLNGTNIMDSNINTSDTSKMAIYGGTSFDVLTFKSWADHSTHEFYLHGIEQIHLPGLLSQQLILSESQSNLNQTQWNLQAMDVPSAWRFGKGSDDVILVSLDAGVPNQGADPQIKRVVNQTNRNNNPAVSHGNDAMTVMAGTTIGIAPNNPLWAYNIYRNYGGIYLTDAIQDALKKAEDLSTPGNTKKVVFQTGVQGDAWWYENPEYKKGKPLPDVKEFTQSVLNNTTELGNNFFAVAAGNCIEGQPKCYESVSGVASASSTNKNIASIGAMENHGDSFGWINADPIVGPNNLATAKPMLASYSNRGSNLTLSAPTDSLAIFNSKFTDFNGTSDANPNAAGVAALVWSRYTDFTGEELKETLTHSAQHFGTGPDGFSNSSGYGMLNADSAVRRANALAVNESLANLWSSDEFIS